MSDPAIDAEVRRYDLTLDVPFTIARDTTDVASVVAVELEPARSGASRADPVSRGIGAASPAAYYGEDADIVEAALPSLLDVVTSAEAVPEDLEGVERIERRLRETAPEDAAARAAVSIALYDLVGRRQDRPLHECWGLDGSTTPPTSFSIGIAEPDAMAERAAAAVERGHDHLKIKLGTDRDRERLEAVRTAAPDAAIRVDANCAWDRDAAIERLDLLETCDVELLEQPVAPDDLDALSAVTDHASMPVAADEACVTAADVPAVADACDAVVCKLMKCGGLGPAREQIAAAHEHDLAVMLGCMVESNASIAAAWQLAPAVEYADLDGALLLAEDPYEGIPIGGGAVDLSVHDRAGTGARRPTEQ